MKTNDIHTYKISLRNYRDKRLLNDSYICPTFAKTIFRILNEDIDYFSHTYGNSSASCTNEADS